MKYIALLLAVSLMGCGASEHETEKLTTESNTASFSSSKRLQLGAEDYREALSLMSLLELNRLDGNQAAQQDFILDFHSNRVLVAEAEAMGLDKQPELARRLQTYREKLLIAALIDSQQSEVEVEEQDLVELAREEYLLKRDDLVTPEKRVIHHILLDNYTCECEGVTPMQKAEALRSEITSFEDFQRLAKMKSIDLATADDGGLIPGEIIRDGSLEPTFETAAFTLPEGQVSEPVETKFGIHLIWVAQVIPSKRLQFSDVREEMMEGQVKLAKSAVAAQVRTDAYPNLQSIDYASFAELVGRIIEEKGQ